MKAHIEYDDFGEYIEVLEDENDCGSFKAECDGIREIKSFLQKIYLWMFCSYYVYLYNTERY